MAGSSTINIILNAVDKYSSTLLGLDSALNIVGKGLTAMKSIADIAFAGLSTAADLAKGSFVKLQPSLIYKQRCFYFLRL